MTIVTFYKKELEKRVGKIDDKMKLMIDMFGTPLDGENETEISIEVFPNRPDLLSLEGFCRSFLVYLGKKKNKAYEVKDSGEKLIVSSSPREWPYAFACIIKGLVFDDATIKRVIDIQEKLGGGYLRKRKKGGIGLYPLDKITFPITFKGMKPEDIVFRPLEFPKAINGRQILSQHPTGRTYGEICKSWEKFPVFIDKKEVIMSMPPIINSHDVGKVDLETKAVFLEATGNDAAALLKSITMIATALAEMGGTIYSMSCKQANGKVFVVPDLQPDQVGFDVSYINKNLGLSLSEKEIIGYLEKMGIGVSKNSKGLVALVPAYRTDILHSIDLVEEVAIAYGYHNFTPEFAKIATIGEESKSSVLKKRLRQLLTGLGLLEVSTFHLSTKEKQFKQVGVKEFKEKLIEVIDSKTEHNVLRESLFAQAIGVLSENSDAAYPQKIFEIGKVFFWEPKSETGVGEVERLCITFCHERAGFTEMKQIFDYLMRMFSLPYEIREGEHEGFIEGRVGEIFISGKSVGFLGEVKPIILKNNKIGVPVSCLEMELGVFL